MTVVQMPAPPPGGFKRRNEQVIVNWVLSDDGTNVLVLQETSSQVEYKNNLTEFDTEQEALDYINEQGLNYDPVDQ